MTTDAVGLREHRRARNAPWSADQAARLIVSNLGALAGILTTAYGASSTHDPQTAIVWFNLCLASLAFAGVSNALWLLRCHSATSTRRADVLDEVVDTIRLPASTASRTAEGFVVAPGIHRYHRASCAFVAGRPVRPMTARDRQRGRHVPCEVCIR